MAPFSPKILKIATEFSVQKLHLKVAMSVTWKKPSLFVSHYCRLCSFAFYAVIPLPLLWGFLLWVIPALGGQFNAAAALPPQQG